MQSDRQESKVSIFGDEDGGSRDGFAPDLNISRCEKIEICYMKHIKSGGTQIFCQQRWKLRIHQKEHASLRWNNRVIDL
jgi:hypothetical protein